jgi:hypothetical protein
MTNSTLLLLCFLLILATLIAFFPLHQTALAESNCNEYFDPDCNDGILMNGYNWRGFWVPGLINIPTHFMPSPQHTAGYAVYYAPGIMRATASYMGFDLTGYLDGVAMMSPADIGATVWIKRWEEDEYEGPFLVVDTSEWDDHYPITVYRREVVEVGWATAQRWGFVDEWLTGVNVWKGINPPPEEPYPPVRYSDWFQEIVEYLPSWWMELPSRPVFKAPHQWLIGGKWTDFLDREHKEIYLERWIRDIIYRTGTGD